MPFHFPDRKTLPHDRPLWLGHGENYFLTLCCHERSANQLCRPEVAAAVFESLAFRQERGDWYPHLCRLMPDHLHALVHLPSDRQLRHVVEDWKRLIAQAALPDGKGPYVYITGGEPLLLGEELWGRDGLIRAAAAAGAGGRRRAAAGGSSSPIATGCARRDP